MDKFVKFDGEVVSFSLLPSSVTVCSYLQIAQTRVLVPSFSVVASVFDFQSPKVCSAKSAISEECSQVAVCQWSVSLKVTMGTAFEFCWRKKCFSVV